MRSYFGLNFLIFDIFQDWPSENALIIHCDHLIYILNPYVAQLFTPKSVFYYLDMRSEIEIMMPGSEEGNVK